MHRHELLRSLAWRCSPAWELASFLPSFAGIIRQGGSLRVMPQWHLPRFDLTIAHLRKTISRWSRLQRIRYANGPQGIPHVAGLKVDRTLRVRSTLALGD